MDYHLSSYNTSARFSAMLRTNRSDKAPIFNSLHPVGFRPAKMKNTKFSVTFAAKGA